MKGTVEWFNGKKRYGFIKGEDGEKYFVHLSSIPQGTFIRENDEVSFDPVETDKGKQAQNIVLLQKGSEKTDNNTSNEQENQQEMEPSEDF